MNTTATTASELAFRIRTAIEEGVWLPGDALRQEDLASRYGASRIPVREALQLLHAQGLVRVAPNRGAFVTALDAAEVDEIFDLRVMLESYLLRAAVPQHGSRSIARLEAIQQDLEHEDTRAGWLQGDRLFHEALYEPAGKQRSSQFVATLRDQVERYALSRVGPGTRRAEWKREHRELIAAVREKHPARALAALSRHLNETRAAVLKSLPPAAG